MVHEKCSKRFMDVYFKYHIEHYTDEEIADRLCMSFDRVKDLKHAMQMRNDLKTVEVNVPVDSKFGKVAEEKRTIDFDVVQPQKLVIISHAPKKLQLDLIMEAAEKQLSTREVQQKVKEINIKAGNPHSRSLAEVFKCPICGSNISKKMFFKIQREVKKA